MDHTVSANGVKAIQPEPEIVRCPPTWEAKIAFAAGDYAAAMRTGVVCRKLKTVGGSSKEARVVEEYEINTALIESLNSVERRAAIETGQEVDRQDINLRGKVNDEAEVLKRAFSFDELAAMDRRMKAARDGKVIEAPAAPATDPESGNQAERGSSGSSWRD
jgi:hypothetical protein